MRGMIYLGVDPGKKGGWALLDDTGFVTDAATLNLDDLSGFANAVAEADMIGLERAQGSPDQGAQFEYGRGFGRLEGVIAAVKRDWTLAGINYFAPAFWKARIGCPTDKKKAVAFARSLMPELYQYENRLGNVPDGLAEAALMGRSMLNVETMRDLQANAAKRARAKARKRVSYRD